MRRLGLLLFLSLLVTAADAKLNVVTTTTDLESLVKTIGGEGVIVFAVAKGTQDPHQIEAKPSFMIRFRDADLTLSQGLELESAWLLPLIQGSRNPKVKPGSRGFLELGPALNPIEIPADNATRADGDVHPGGNPHFQLDPLRLGQAAVLIAERMGELDTDHKDLYLKNALDFKKHMEEKTKEWKKRLEKTKIKEVVTYHKTFSYFLDRFGIQSPLQLEPKPGIPPTASHLISVIDDIKKRKIKLVLIENFYEDSVGEKIKTQVADIKINRVPVSVGGEPEIKNNEQLFEKLVRSFEDAK